MIITDYPSETTLEGDGNQGCLTVPEFKSAVKYRTKNKAEISESREPMMQVIAGIHRDLGTVGKYLDPGLLYKQWAAGEFLLP